jgi:hypothetical protein
MRIIIIFLAAAILSSCNEQNTTRTETGFVIQSGRPSLLIVEVDSCEYLYGNWDVATVLTHKGNCKYCEIRNHK